jgi:hypothetical protein
MQEVTLGVCIRTSFGQIVLELDHGHGTSLNQNAFKTDSASMSHWKALVMRASNLTFGAAVPKLQSA